MKALTAREQQVHDLLLSEKTMDKIAVELGVTVNTAKAHAQHVYIKADATGRRELMARHIAFLGACIEQREVAQ